MEIIIEDLEKHFPELIFKNELGRGGDGVVFFVEEKGLRKKRALKILTNESAFSRAQFNKEGHVLKLLDHPNIVKYYGSGERGKYSFLLMEYCPNVSLLYRIAQRPFSDEAAATVVMKIAKTLQYLHDEKILHRDIKPENVMITRRDEPKLVDFGLAFCAGEDVQELTAIGSEGYAAPELWTAPEKVCVQTDIYALGALLYTVLTQTFPDPHNVNFNHLYDRDSAFIHIIIKAMSKDRSRRHKSGNEFAAELAQIVANIGRPPPLW